MSFNSSDIKGMLYPDRVRKNIHINQQLYEESLEIARSEGMNFSEYVRNLLRMNIKSKSMPPSIPSNNINNVLQSEGWRVDLKKRQKLIKIMHDFRGLL